MCVCVCVLFWYVSHHFSLLPSLPPSLPHLAVWFEVGYERNFITNCIELFYSQLDTSSVEDGGEGRGGRGWMKEGKEKGGEGV